MINITTSIKQAFFDHHHFVRFYNLLNTFFLEDKIGAIQEAKTISVVVRCAELHQTYGFSYLVLFERLNELFGDGSHLALSLLVDLNDFESFESRVADLQAKYGTRGDRVSLQINFEQKVA